MDTAPPPPAGTSSQRLTLLVWDAPNLDMGLAGLLGRQPRGEERPRFDAIARWLVSRADADEVIEACIFTNVPQDGAGRIAGWVKMLRSYGYSVFVKPRVNNSDIDEDMIEHVQRRAGEMQLSSLYVASGDGRLFREPLEELTAEGVDVTVIGFAEESTYALVSDALQFADLEDVPEAFLTPLPRARLDNIPVEGRWLPPLAPLRDAVRRPGSDFEEPALP
jgi:uncharacterized protein